MLNVTNVRSDTNVRRIGLTMNSAVWRNFRLDFFQISLASLFVVVFNQFYIPLAIQHGASNVLVGWIAAAPAIGSLVAPLWAGIIDQRHPKPFVVYPNLAARILLLAIVFYDKAWMFVAMALLIQLLLSVQAPAYASFVTRMYPSELRGRLMGYVRVAMSALMIPAAYLVGYWIDRSGGKGSILVAVVLGVVSVYVLSKIKDFDPNGQAAEKKTRTPFKEQLRLVKENRQLALFLGAMTLAGFGNLLAVPLYQIIQVEKLELTNLQIGYTRMAYFFCLLIGFLTMGWVIDRFSPKMAMLFDFAASGIVPVIYLIFWNYPSVLVANGFLGAADATGEIGCLAYVLRLFPERAAVVYGLHLMLFGVRGTIAPILSTNLIQSVSMEAMLSVAALTCLMGLVMLVLNKDSADEAKLKVT